MRAAAAALAAALLALVPASGCGGAPPREYVSEPGAYDRISERDLDRVRAARAAERVGDQATTRAILENLALRLPANIYVQTLLQDYRLRVAEQLASGPREERLAEIGELYRSAAEATPSVPHLLLAARIEADPEIAERRLIEAREADPACLWAWYGLAHLRVIQSEFAEARELLERALELDSGHLAARRLEINLLARAGEFDRAIPALEGWLVDAADDPRIDAAQREAATVDLAVLLAERGRPLEAREVLARAVEPEPADELRLRLVRAAVDAAGGDALSALRAAQDGALFAPDDPRPLAQQALLHEYWLDDPASALIAWTRLLEVLEERGAAEPLEEGAGLSWVFLRIQAQVERERLERRLAEPPGEQP